MPDLMDRLYCSEQIHIPPAFPFIMKLYCKAAIRTQPYDLLKWSAAYFRALANGEEPPVKDRIEYPPYDSPTGLTPGYIKILIKQLGKDPEAVVSAGTVFAKWNCACLEDELLVKLVALLGARTSFNWLKFVAIAAGFISNSLTNTMVLLCELLTDEPEGGMATIPLGLFCDLYTFLAELECGPLTEEERKRIDSMESVEDASVVADKIRSAVYEASAEGEYAAEEGPVVEVRSEGPLEFAVAPEEGGRMGEEGEDKAPASEAVPAEVKELEEIPGEMSDEGESSSKEDEPFKEDEEDLGSLLTGDGEEGASEKEHEKPEKTESPTPSVVEKEEGEKKEEAAKEESSAAEKKPGEEAHGPTEEKAEHLEEKPEEKPEEAPVDTRLTRRIKVSDVEETIRQKIAERLDESSQSGQSDENFEALGSYLLDAASKLKKYTAEEMGFAIFKRFMRQEVPGIGPKLDTDQLDKVLDFMDYNGSKQQGMVMPRNIRHWMCPPLDKVILPEP